MNSISIVYRNEWITERIYRESDKLTRHISNTAYFEERCIKDIAQYLTLSKTNAKNISYINRLIDRKAHEARRVFRNEISVSFETLSKESPEGETIEYEPEDVLVDVESEVIAKEMTALLAQDDRRKKAILERWAIGNTNDWQVAEALARLIGGNAESHRKFIQRFRVSCREELSAII